MANSRKKAKSYRKKRGLRLLYLLLSFVLIVAAVVVGSVLFFQVEAVEVSGSSKYSGEQVLAVAQVDQNANLLLLPEGAIIKRIQDSLPYVDEVKLKREFPTTLKIIIQECIPLATTYADGAWYILDDGCKVLEQTEESIASSYIQLAGLSLKEPKVGEAAQVSEEEVVRLKSLRGLLTSLQEKDMAKNVQWIDLTGDTAIEMGYMGRFTILLPISTEYDDTVHGNEAYHREIDVLQQIIALLDQTNRGIIDLRYENGYFRPR
jgi:cell division protein FtsQ